jgi:hypothetical protein
MQKLQPSLVPGVRRAKPNLIWYGAGCLVLAVGLLSLLGVGGYLFVRWRTGAFDVAAPREARWDGRTPLRCAGNDQMTVRGVNAALPSGAAIVATDNCVLTLEDVNVTAPIALQAQGNARVTVYRGSLHGSQLALVAMGTARVILWQTRVDGGMNTAAPASIEMHCRDNLCWSSDGR